AFDNQEYPFETLVKKVVRLKDPKRNPLFDVMFSFQNFRPPTVEFVEEGGHQQGEGFIYENPMTKFELTLIGVEVGGGLEFVLQYSAKLFKKETIQRFTGYFIEIMETVTKKVNSSEKRDIKLKEIKISHDLIERKLDVIKDDDGDFVF
ncbi:MAG: hypothetical protein GY757_33090, partial [bacterium]|nr:hypothetical protein [bacterium]